MIVADLSRSELANALAAPGLRLRTGPFVARIQSRLQAVAAGIALHYGQHAVDPPDGFADFHVRVARPPGLRRWLQPQVLFQFEGAPPFLPLPADQAFPMLEWGLNWCVSAHCHQYLIVHAAVVERSGHALILPAPPGSGKSTLCAGLVSRGWRLLSDELTLIESTTAAIVPLPRPISLKNASIEVIRNFSPGAVLGPTVRDTVKGAVSHMTPPRESVARASELARPRWIVVPIYKEGADTQLVPLSRGSAFMQVADSAFNYHLHGRTGFDVLTQIVASSECYELAYGDLDEAVELFDELAIAA